MTLAEQFLARLDAMKTESTSIKAVTVRMDYNTVAGVDAFAKRYGLSRSEFIALMVSEFLHELKRAEPLSSDEFRTSYLEVVNEEETE